MRINRVATLCAIAHYGGFVPFVNLFTTLLNTIAKEFAQGNTNDERLFLFPLHQTIKKIKHFIMVF